jgi:hypothetical protein
MYTGCGLEFESGRDQFIHAMYAVNLSVLGKHIRMCVCMRINVHLK